MHARRAVAAALFLAAASSSIAITTAPAVARGSHRSHGIYGSAGQRHHSKGHGVPHFRPRHEPPHSHPTPHEASVQVVATGLNQPKKLTVAPDGSLIVALSGDGAAPASCTDGTQLSCLDDSGAIDRVTPWGSVSTLLGNLPSVSSEGEATGPAEARLERHGLEVLFQNTNLNTTTGEDGFGPGGALLGDLVRFSPFQSPAVEASFGPFEAANNPDHGAGSGVEFGLESAIDSDPYSFVPYRGGYAVADAAANDLLFVAPSGKISVLAVFPTISETAPAGSLGPTQTTPVPVQAQAVPDSVAVGPEGALYVGELGGFPFEVGASSVYRVVPGSAPTLYASGFTAIGDIGFDRAGRLLVLEIDEKGLNDPALSEAETLPAPGQIIGIHHNGTRTVLASTGLEFATGMAVNPEGQVYVSNFGVLPATGGPGGLSGEVVHVTLPSSWEDSGW